MRVLLTGHQGYLGTVAAPLLVAAGHEVVGLDRGLFADCLLGLLDVPDVPGLDTDLRDLTIEQLAGFDAVVHLAPTTRSARSRRRSPTTSTSPRPPGWPAWPNRPACRVTPPPARSKAPSPATTWSTRTPTEAVTPYAISKVRVEDEIAELADADFVPFSLRNATAFGFSPRLRADIVLNDLVGRAVRTGRVTVLSDGTTWRPLAHAQDIARP